MYHDAAPNSQVKAVRWGHGHIGEELAVRESLRDHHYLPVSCDADVVRVSEHSDIYMLA